MTVAPGPGLGVLFELRELRRNPLQFMLDRHAQYGDIVRLGAGSHSAHLLAHPRFADHVLRARHHNYDRNTRSAAAVREVTGESMLTNAGKTWREHRLLIQPAFQSAAVRRIAPFVIDATREIIESWRNLPNVDVAAAMMHLTFNVAGRAFFGSDVDAHAAELENLLPLIFEETFLRSTAIIPIHLLTRRERQQQFRAALQRLDEIVRAVMARGGSNGMISALLAQKNEDGTPRLSTDEVRNETVALLLAGHETTANALAWTLYLLASHGDVLQSARDEIAATLGDREPDADDVERLPFTTAVFHEALRLYPPIWIVERRAIEEDEIDGYEIPAGSIAYVSPYVLHRRPDFWDEPDKFDPRRFEGEKRHESFLPFGAGPHHCIGAHFAMLEARIVLTMLLQRVDFALAPGIAVEPEAWITLRPRGGVPMQVKVR